MFHFACLRCKNGATTPDEAEAARWLDGTHEMPCGHKDADFLPDPDPARGLVLATARTPPRRTEP